VPYKRIKENQVIRVSGDRISEYQGTRKKGTRESGQKPQEERLKVVSCEWILDT